MKYEFPTNLYDERHGHFMRIVATPSRFQGGESDTFVLPMPIGQESFLYKQEHSYAELKLSRAAAGIPGFGDYAGAAGTLAAIAGAPVNPMLEVIYENTNLRTFRFSFLFAPESAKESELVENICRRMRFHAAPTISEYGGVQGFFMYSPSKFKIDFHTLVNGTWKSNSSSVNPTMPQIYDGVIDAIGVNYAPANGIFSTFSNGYPVAVELGISFRETRIIDKNLINKGY